jgi:hypothetical protein
MRSRLLAYLTGSVLAFSMASAQTVVPGGNVSGLWTISGSPYLIEGEITIPAGEILFIDPGVEVNFQGHYKLIVNGSIEAIGTEADSVVFTAANTTDGWHGIRLIDASSESVLEYCVIKYGNATGSGSDEHGGGVYCYHSDLVISHCLFTENRALSESGGGIFVQSCDEVNITENRIEYNTAGHGAGMNIHYTDALIEGNYVCHNEAIGWSGAGISVRGCSPIIHGNVVNDNISVEDSGTGIYADFEAHPVITYNEVAYNNFIGVFAGADCYPELTNNTIAMNGTWAVEAYGDSHYEGRNNIIWGNGLNFYLWGGCSVNLTYSDIQDGWPGIGNIEEDPLFVDPAGGDFHLQEGSPCIDAGDPMSPPDPDGTRADMGAYYFHQEFSGTYVSGEQYGLWDLEGSPYVVTGEVVIPADCTLTIEAGVEVLFQGTLRMFTDGGSINALGTETDMIYFGPFWGWEHWGSIHFINTPDENPLTFSYCVFEHANGSPTNNRWGGAFWSEYGHFSFDHCIFQNNHAYTGAAKFGHLSQGSFEYCEIFDNHNDWKGGAINFNTGTVDFIYTAICNNTAVNEAGGVYAWLGDLNFTNCTIAGNSASEGGGIFNYPSGTHIDVLNCIIYDNEGGNITGPGASTVAYSDVGGGWTGTGNIDADPLFVDPVGNDYHLLSDSPCIDTGDPASPPDPDGTRADMGAYYYHQGPPGNLTVFLEPVNPPIIIPPEGGSFEFEASVHCDEVGNAFFDAWTELVLPDGQIMGPMILRENRFIEAGNTVSFDCELYVSMWAMPGVYEYHGLVGEYPDEVYSEDFFEFEKQPAGDIVPEGATAVGILNAWGMEEEFDLPAAKSKIVTKLTLSSSPNPFNAETALRFSLPDAGHTKLTLYDIAGRTVATLLDRQMEAGWHTVSYNAEHLASGIYLAVVDNGQETFTQRLLLLK